MQQPVMYILMTRLIYVARYNILLESASRRPSLLLTKRFLLIFSSL